MAYRNICYPGEIGSFVYDPGRKIVGFHLVVDGELVSRGEFYSKLLEKLVEWGAERGNLRFLKVYQPKEAETL